MKTIAQIAQEQGITKPAIRKYLTDDFRKKFVETISGVIYISEQGERFILSRLAKNKPKTQKETVSANFSETVSEDTENFLPVSALVSTLQEQIKVKDQQLETKDRQLEELTMTIKTQAESIKSMQDLVKNAQTLHAMENVKPQLADGKKRWQFWKK